MKKIVEKIGYIGTLFYIVSIIGKFNGSSIFRGLNENVGIILVVLTSLVFIKDFSLKKLNVEAKLLAGLFLLIPIFLIFSPAGIERGIEYIRRGYKFLPIFLCPLFLNTKERIERVMMLLSMGLLIFSLEVINSYKIINWTFDRGYEGISGGVGYSAHALAILSFIPLGLFVRGYQEKKRMLMSIGLISYGFVGSCVLLGQRRGSWLAFLIPLIAYFISILDKKYLKRLGIALLLGGLFLTIAPKENNTYYKRFISIKDIKEASPSIRLVLWKASFEIYKKYPVFGIGDKEVAPYYEEYFEENKDEIIKKSSEGVYREALKFGKIGYIHSMYFASLSMMGSLSFYFIFVLLYLLFEESKLTLKLKNMKNKDYIYSLTLASMTLAFLIVGLTESAWNETFIRAPFFAGVILYLSLKQILKKSENNEMVLG